MRATPLTVADASGSIPMPVVTLNRWLLAGGVVVALLLQQPLVTTALLAILIPGALFGQRWNVVFQIGKRLFATRNLTAEREDARLQRFNSTIAIVLLLLAQIAFLSGFSVLAWAFALLVAAASVIALAGYCVGCLLYFQVQRLRFRLSSRS